MIQLFGPAHLSFGQRDFLENGINIKGHHFQILPIGSGHRICPGAQLGLHLVTLILGHFLHHFEWVLPYGVKFENFNLYETQGVVAYMASSSTNSFCFKVAYTFVQEKFLHVTVIL